MILRKAGQRTDGQQVEPVRPTSHKPPEAPPKPPAPPKPAVKLPTPAEAEAEMWARASVRNLPYVPIPDKSPIAMAALTEMARNREELVKRAQRAPVAVMHPCRHCGKTGLEHVVRDEIFNGVLGVGIYCPDKTGRKYTL